MGRLRRIRQTAIRAENLLYLSLTALVVVGGYAYLRYAYRVTDRLPFAREIVIIVLGTIATVLITALLLNKQTEVELRKEQGVKLTELKSQMYLGLLDHLQGVVERRQMSRAQVLALQFLTHKLALLASASVLRQYNVFLDVLEESVAGGELDDAGVRRVMQAIALLSAEIRADLLGDDALAGELTLEELRAQIVENTADAMELRSTR